MKKRTVNILLGIMVVVGIGIGCVTGVSMASTGHTPEPYPVNENGQTYGGIDPYSIVPQEEPDLIAAMGIDGTLGYIYAADVDGDKPSTPEEAAIYMENLERTRERARAAGEVYLRLIPLYDSDGVTVIGEYGISY